MKRSFGLKSIAPERTAIIGYYLIGFVATFIGISVVILLNMFTPIDHPGIHVLTMLRNQETPLLYALIFFMLPRLLFFVLLAFGPLFICMHRLIRPVSLYLASLRSRQPSRAGLKEKAQRRLLEIPLRFAPINVLIWILMPAAFFGAGYMMGYINHRVMIIMTVRASMVGLIASTVASLRMEAYFRKTLIPLFFPEGRLTEVKGMSRFSVSKRIRLVNRIGSIVPMTILIVTLITLQWEVKDAALSAAEYGRGILMFAIVLFVYAFVANGIMNRVVSRSITRPLDDTVRVLQRIRKGAYDQRVSVVSNDEIGYTGDVVNEMTSGLKEREQMQESLKLAREVQLNLLPKTVPNMTGVDLAGRSIYCDETGGDYFDFMELESAFQEKIGLVVGDVSGHGISSALLMATVRALLRLRVTMPGSSAQTITDVNRQLTKDVGDSGQFMTLFYLVLDSKQRQISWVRAGHDPAILYNPSEDTFEELGGPGVALGVLEDWSYEENVKKLPPGEAVLMIGTDGIWEAANAQGERFGKERLYPIIRQHRRAQADKILQAILADVEGFQNGQISDDDRTLIVAKF